MKADDGDGGSFGAITYSIGSGPASATPNQFTINKETGQICTSVALDRDEGSDSFDFTVTASDGVRNCSKYCDTAAVGIRLFKAFHIAPINSV